MQADALFARHLNLAALRGRRRGLVRCIFHQEKTASLSIDLDGGVFNCFGCGENGGVKKFAELVGEGPAPPPITRTPFAEIVAHARSQKWNRDPGATISALSDWIRRTRADVARVRDEARFAPRDDEAMWATLQRAAHLETLAQWVEHELDGVLLLGPIA